MKLIKELRGFSGSQVLLIQDPDIRVRKIGNVSRNLERYQSLSNLKLPLPKILSTGADSYDMEYIANLDIKTYLNKNQVHLLADFLKSTLDVLSENSAMKDYSSVYRAKLEAVDFTGLNFGQQDLLDRLPRSLPCSNYHGDLTLENVIYDVNHQTFVLIDPLTTDYDSYVFDLAKLRQDITCHWFIRNDVTSIKPKLQNLFEELSVYDYFTDDSTLILMLLRVLPYLQGKDREYVINEANKLWK